MPRRRQIFLLLALGMLNIMPALPAWAEDATAARFHHVHLNVTDPENSRSSSTAALFGVRRLPNIAARC